MLVRGVCCDPCASYFGINTHSVSVSHSNAHANPRIWRIIGNVLISLRIAIWHTPPPNQWLNPRGTSRSKEYLPWAQNTVTLPLPKPRNSQCVTSTPCSIACGPVLKPSIIFKGDKANGRHPALGTISGCHFTSTPAMMHSTCSSPRLLHSILIWFHAENYDNGSQSRGV